MDIAKKLKSIKNWQDKALVFLFLVLFPFGQLLKINLYGLKILLVDVVAISCLVRVFCGQYKKTKIHSSFGGFLILSIFSLFVSTQFLSFGTILRGSFYLVRLVSYFALYLVSKKAVSEKSYKKNQLNSLLAVLAYVALFGWVQYLVIPDLTFLKHFGWDDHLFRLTSTFLDPGFTSIFLVFGFFISFLNKSKNYLWISIFFLATLALTFSRAGYLALLAGLVTFGFLQKNIKTPFLFGLLFTIMVLLLPRPAGEGVNLARTYSISARTTNYRETLQIFKKFPVFGVGFNNICEYKQKMFGVSKFSNSCSGADSSLLLVLSTTGALGLISFLDLAKNTWNTLEEGVYADIFRVCFVALFAHSFFVNSIFYPFVLGFMAILLSLAVRE